MENVDGGRVGTVCTRFRLYERLREPVENSVDGVEKPRGRRAQAKTPIVRNFARRTRRSSSAGTSSSSSSAADERRLEQRSRLVVVVLRPALGLGDDAVDHAQLQAVPRVRLERAGRLLRLVAVAPEDQRAPLGRDHRVDRVLLHQHAVGDGERDRAARAALADDARDGRHAEAQHRGLRARDRAALPVLLRRDARVRAGRVDQRHDREAEAVRDRHHAHRLRVALRVAPCRTCARGAPSRRGPSDGRSARPSARRACRCRRRARRRRHGCGRRGARPSRR